MGEVEKSSEGAVRDKRVTEGEGARSNTVRLAVIGLLGTMLTVCGGVSGALVSGVVTVYQLERKMQQVSVGAAGSGQALSIDTGGIFISRSEAAALNPGEYYVELEGGVAVRRPLEGWGEVERLTLAEQLAETGVTVAEDELGQQAVYRIRYGDTIEMQVDRETTINGYPMREEIALALEALYGGEPWTVPYHTQIIVNVFDRGAEEHLGIRNLAQAMLGTMRFNSSRIHRLIAPAGRDFIIVQGGATYANAALGGRSTSITVEDWFLFAETEESYYIVEIVYTPQSGQSLQVWNDLQAYMDSFRVIR